MGTEQVGKCRTISEVAAELDRDWSTVNTTVTRYGKTLLAADRKRLNATSVIRLDETKFAGSTADVRRTSPLCAMSLTNKSSISCLALSSSKSLDSSMPSYSSGNHHPVRHAGYEPDLPCREQCESFSLSPHAVHTTDHLHVITGATTAPSIMCDAPDKISV